LIRLLLLAAALCAAYVVPAKTQEIGPVTDLPLPRFVSLASSEVNMRRGPGEEYEIEWIYSRRGYPVEVVQEYFLWRRVRDVDGEEGWVHYAMLSPTRTALVLAIDGSPAPVPIRVDPASSATVSAYLQPGVIARVITCRAAWCELSDQRFEGWIEQDLLWGVYAGEQF
jgi:SH3-like domain-containing protein